MDPKGHGPDAGNLTGLVLTSVSKSYGNSSVLKEVSLRVSRGEMFCLLGPSGCGKTTILKIIAGLLDHDNGTVILDGKDISALAPQKREVSLVFQSYALFPHMTVFDNVAYGLRRRRTPGAEMKRRVNEMLNLVRLGQYERRRIHELSGGEQQRIALARALVVHPKVLLLDEPLSNLDARLRADLRLEILRIHKELRLTTIYVTHDQEEAMSLADRIAVMNAGRVEQIGTPRQIYDSPDSRFVADFIGQSNFIESEMKGDTVTVLGKTLHHNGDIPDSNVLVCAIRPERIRLSRWDESSPAAIIQDILFFGPTVRYRLKLQSAQVAQMLMAEVPASQAVFQIGDLVGLEVNPEDIHLFPRSPLKQ